MAYRNSISNSAQETLVQIAENIVKRKVFSNYSKRENMWWLESTFFTKIENREKSGWSSGTYIYFKGMPYFKPPQENQFGKLNVGKKLHILSNTFLEAGYCFSSVGRTRKAILRLWPISGKSVGRTLMVSHKYTKVHIGKSGFS